MKNCIKRALRTFIQAAVGYIAVAIPTIDFSDTSVLKTALLGVATASIAAGLAATMNLNDEKGAE